MMRWKLLAAIGSPFFAAFSASAEPLDVAHVGADAAWVAHLDVDAVRASTVVQRAWEKMLAKDRGAEARLAMAKTLLGMDLAHDIHGMTFYGTQIGKHEGVALIFADMDAERLSALSAALPGREAAEHGECEIHSWKKHNKTMAAAFHSPSLLVIGSSVDAVRSALDVLNGEAAHLEGDSPLAGNIPAGTTFLMRAEGLADAELHSRAPIAKQLESLRLASGEADGTSFMRARFRMMNRDAAELALQAVHGWQAQGALLCPDELGRTFIAALRPKLEDQTLTLLWSASADDVWQAMEQLEKTISKKRMAHRNRHGKHRDQAHGCPLCKGGDCPFCSMPKGDDSDPHGDDQKGEAPKSASPEEDF